jgi:hypothetical protein
MSEEITEASVVVSLPELSRRTRRLPAAIYRAACAVDAPRGGEQQPGEG